MPSSDNEIASDSIGKLTVGNTILKSGGKWTITRRSSATSPVAGIDNDLVDGSGSSSLDLTALASSNRFLIQLEQLTGGTPLASGTSISYIFARFDTITGPGIVPNSTGDITSLFDIFGAGSDTGRVTYDTMNIGSTTLNLTLTPVPEPAGLLAAFGLASIAAFARRRSKLRSDRARLVD